MTLPDCDHRSTEPVRPGLYTCAISAGRLRGFCTPAECVACPRATSRRTPPRRRPLPVKITVRAAGSAGRSPVGVERPLHPDQLAGKPCRYLGELLETRTGNSCTCKGKPIPIHRCGVHLRCSTCSCGAYLSLPVCRLCDEYEPAETAGEPGEASEPAEPSIAKMPLNLNQQADHAAENK